MVVLLGLLDLVTGLLFIFILEDWNEMKGSQLKISIMNLPFSTSYNQWLILCGVYSW